MSDILEIPASNVSNLKFNSPERSTPKALSTSEDGCIAILYPTSLLIGFIGCDPTNEDKKYVFNEEKIFIDFGFESIIKVADFDFKKSIEDKLIDDDVILNMMLDTNYTVASSSKDNVMETYCSVEWSPMDVVTNKSFLAISRFDGRIVVLGHNKTANSWEKEFDITDLYYRHYKDKILKSQLDGNIVKCKQASEYIEVKNDLKLIDFSWSVLMRQFKSHQYCMLVTLSYTGIITIWRIINDHASSGFALLHSERLDIKGVRPLNVKFCDISETSFLITIVDCQDLVTSYPFSIVVNNQLTVESSSPPLIINQQARYCQQTKIQWSMGLCQLLVGFEWKLLVSKIVNNEKGAFQSESAMLYLPSNSEISGLCIKNNTAYVTTKDGFLFGIKLSPCVSSLELCQIIFQNPELHTNKIEYIDVFISPNSVYLGFLKRKVDRGSKPLRFMSDIVMISLVSEAQALNILMNDNIPFSRKQDAVEEMRHLYFNKKNNLKESLKKIGDSDVKWETSTLHRLQFVRYICIFFGYQLNFNHELIESGKTANQLADFSKIRKLESIIILKNISYWLDSFCEMDNEEISKDDCLFVLRVVRKLELLSDNHIKETVEAAHSKCTSVLIARFHGRESDLRRCKDVAEDITCVVCGELCQFNLFTLKCSKNHVLPRCCKSLDICTNKVKKCQMCGATEKLVNLQDLSNWRLEIVNSNCPLCDGKMVNLAF